MAQSPRSTWSGFIELGLVNIPVSIAKATGEPEKVSDVVKEIDYDETTKTIDLISRNERNARTGKPVANKQHAIQLEENRWFLIDSEDWKAVEEATKTPTLKITETHPINRLPMIYSQATYYVRHDAKSKVQPVALANLIAAMTKDRIGMICQWGSSHRQKLCVLSAESGVMIMRVIPHLTEVRVASKMERSHMAVKPDPKLIDKFSELLGEFRTEKFNYSVYADEGLKRRRAIIKKVLKGEKFKEPEQENPIDVFEALEIALAERAAKRDKIATTTNN
jgi:DNA end-binding protein Ku